MERKKGDADGGREGRRNGGREREQKGTSMLGSRSDVPWGSIRFGKSGLALEGRIAGFRAWRREYGRFRSWPICSAGSFRSIEYTKCFIGISRDMGYGLSLGQPQ